MNHRAGARLAWATWALTLAILVALFVFSANYRVLLDDPFLFFATPLLTIGYATVGALIAAKNPKNPIGWLMLMVALGWV